MFLEQLTRPFAYLKIKGTVGKTRYDWLVPIFFMVTTLILLYFSDIKYTDVNSSLLDPITAFIANLPGFYIAALAAIATFQNPRLTETMLSAGTRTPYIKTKYLDENNRVNTKNKSLTRRTYLTHMFAFLTAESFVLVILNKLSVTIDSPYIFGCYIVVFLTLFWQLVVTTFCGLYYLGERLHE